MSYKGSNKRIVKNTLMLYIRMILIMFITLYTSRVVLEVLGIEDYGIYNIVGGLVVTFSLLTNSLSSVGARYITFHLGSGDFDKLKSVYSNTVNIQIYLSLVIIVVAESLGLWFLNSKLNIPENRMYAANWVYQFSVLTFVARLLTVPYNSMIIAHERMSIYAYISIVEVLMQLGIVYLLLFVKTDSLILYSSLTFGVSVFILVSYYLYCKRQFEECCFSTRIEKALFKEMASFAGWNFIGMASGVLRNQGVDIIVNLFFGVTISAARGIANQVSTAITKFSQSFTTAINPQITKSYATGDYERLHFLIFQGSRFTYYLLFIISFPIIIEAPYILKLWLKDVPEYSVIFTRLQVILSLITCLSQTNITAMLATGDIKKYQIVVGLVSLLNFPLSYVFLKLGCSAFSTYLVAIGVELCCLYARFYISKQLVGIDFSSFVHKVGGRVVVVTLFSTILPFILNIYLDTGIIKMVIVCIMSFFWSSLIIFILGLQNHERVMVIDKVKKKLKKSL